MSERLVDEHKVKDDRAVRVGRVLEDVELLHALLVENGLVDGREGDVVEASPFLREEELLQREGAG